LQPTLLIQATTDEGAVGNLLTAVTRTGQNRATAITLPADLVVTPVGGEPESIRRTVASLDTLRAPTAVAATLGVRVDAAWRLDRKALAGLVDSVGGVRLDVADEMRIRDEEGVVVLRLQPGPQSLSGTAASWYAVGDVRKQADLQMTDRFFEVMQSTLSALPDDELAIRESLTALGALAPSTIGTQELSTYLVDYGSAMRAQSFTSVELATTPIVIGDDFTWRWVNYRKAAKQLTRTLPLAQWRVDVDGSPRVVVTAPDEQPGWIGSTRVPLEDADFLFVDGRGTPARGKPVKVSEILTQGDPNWGSEIAEALQLRDPIVSVTPPKSTTPKPWGNSDVQLGSDYVPQS